MVSSSVVAVLLVASLLSPTAILLVEDAQNQMDALNNQFKTVMDDTMSFFDDAWEVAKQFQNPDYDYDPSALGNHTIIARPPLPDS
jgi:hypothetical protein